MFVIEFRNNERVRYAIATKGDPLYNAIDSGTVAGAKTWKTGRGAQKFLDTHILEGREGDRLREKWECISVVEIADASPLEEAQARYQTTEKGKARQRRYREKEDVQEKRREYDRKRNRAKYMREYRKRNK